MNAFTVIVLAAGRGTRMRSERPKALHEICGRPMILWPVCAAIEAGADQVIVVDAPRRELASVLPGTVEIAVQRTANGTGGATAAAAPLLRRDRPVIILSGDVPLLSAQTIRSLLQAHLEGGCSATVLSIVPPDPAGYGRIVRDGGGELLRIVETKVRGDASADQLHIDEVNAGVYAFDGGALLDVLPRLDAENAQGELYLTQALPLLREARHRVTVHRLADPSQALGVNDRVSLATVSAIAQRAILERHMRAGVTIVDPHSTWIDVDVTIGADARIEPGTQLRRGTSVGEHTTIGPHTIVTESQIGAHCTVRMSWLDAATVRDGATVGPFTFLRPGTSVGESAKAGAFVEIKNSLIASGAKVPHLSYIGDADIGERTNLGAGTITANYDGQEKHRTRIGADVKGGVHTAFVAPVEVGAGAYTGAGSVITEDVPEGALAVARARQKNIDGYRERRSGQGRPAQKPDRGPAAAQEHHTAQEEAGRTAHSWESRAVREQEVRTAKPPAGRTAEPPAGDTAEPPAGRTAKPPASRAAKPQESDTTRSRRHSSP